MEETKKGEIIIYKAVSGPELSLQIDGETVWMTQNQIAALFSVQKAAISKHVKNIYESAELSQKSTVSILEIVQKEGLRDVKRRVEYYNLDMVISIGYRVNSARATQFRIWATKRLKDYLLKGFAINEERLKDLKNLKVKLKELESAHKLIQKAVASKRLEGYEKELLSIISDYADTWFLLNAYDKGELSLEGLSKRAGPALNYETLLGSISKFKQRLVSQKEAGSLFGQEVGNKFKAVLGNINQTFTGKDLYPSVEEKAAHLLYFLIKDHPFVDGNKRIGALTFLLYLVENNFLYDKRGERKINDNTLTALALLIAESDPKEKEVMVGLVVNLIK
ncbi:MAG: virulence protein RhuM/Fic/DOC family protein [Candidatus Doudnabacteria bacterium]|nr:virulence protein RhuM/Fic/DOC family protein [Candidatus Doudnabacteria bacterium]